MTEAFLQYVWGQRLYASAEQRTTGGDVVEVLNPGRLNTDAGPDFFNAQVRVGGTTWAGNIEVHKTTDDWFRHGHDSDPAYDNVILHVVGQSSGRKVTTSGGETVPEVVLRFDMSLYERYEALRSAKGLESIRCAGVLRSVPSVVSIAWLDALVAERMGQKAELALRHIDEFKGDVDQAFFCLLARSIGSRVNSEPMELMARHTPLRVLLKHNGNIQTEAVLLGQAGLLESCQDDDVYVTALKREYALLRAKFGLSPIDGSIWKYARLRPQNFPDVRLVQLAAIVRALPGNFESCLSLPLNEVLSVTPSEYWDTHYRLGVQSHSARSKGLGVATRRLVMVNAVVPFALAEARRYADAGRQSFAMDLLKDLPMERNSVIDRWREAGIEPQNEADAQALLHLSSAYCDKGECLRCRFGHFAISRGQAPAPFMTLSAIK